MLSGRLEAGAGDGLAPELLPGEVAGVLLRFTELDPLLWLGVPDDRAGAACCGRLTAPVLAGEGRLTAGWLLGVERPVAAGGELRYALPDDWILPVLFCSAGLEVWC